MIRDIETTVLKELKNIGMEINFVIKKTHFFLLKLSFKMIIDVLINVENYKTKNIKILKHIQIIQAIFLQGAFKERCRLLSIPLFI
jgi:hypothetical protein